jgi:DNA replication and repair protein RecF
MATTRFRRQVRRYCIIEGMEIRSLSLENFRCFEKAEFGFTPEITLLLGPNTSGKTTILEAISLLSTTKSFRAEKIEEMIKWQSSIANVRCQIKNGDKKKLEVILTPGEIQGKKAPKRKFFINGVAKRRNNFVGYLLTVLFRPEDIRIITGSPTRRRDFLDDVLVQINWEYSRSLGAYQKGLRQRNKVLEGIREEKAEESDLLFWNQSLAKNEETIFRAREGFVSFVNQFWPEGLRLLYHPNRFVPGKNLEKEVALGMTLTGPHRDDLRIEKQKRDLALFGSRSEQRLAVLNLKLAELEFIQREQDEQPVLLLDDIFSELDEKFREKVLVIISRQQAIMTTAEPELIKKEFLDRMKVVKL